jgi:acyl-coenzyme A synthetase/AMP-(fatty) acid ligase
LHDGYRENTGVNFAVDVLDRLPPNQLALVELARDGVRREWSFGEVSDRSARLAGALARRGVGRGEVVMTLIGNRSEWVLTMLACFRLGAVVLPCTEQLRAKDLRLRLAVARPRLVVADERNRGELALALGEGPSRAERPARDGELAEAGAAGERDGGRAEAGAAGERDGGRAEAGAAGERDGGRAEAGAAGGRDIEVVLVPDDSLFDCQPAAPVELTPEDPCLITFTSGTAGEPKAVLHGQRYLLGQRLQAEHWLGARAGELVWCTAASGWSKSARNVFIAPWLSGAAALLHDARFDPTERLELLARERVNVLCMAPTEYRVIAKRATLAPLPDLRGMVAAGEALDPAVLRTWREVTGLGIRDGYGQTETGQLTGMALDEEPRPGSMGRALPGVRLDVLDGELVADPASVPTFFLGYLGEEVAHAERGPREGVAFSERTPRAEQRRHASSPRQRNAAGWRVADRRAGGPWHTGDRVRRDEQGYLYFEGRTDDVIVSAGYRIGPFEVESALVAHPAVAEAAAVAAPDEERGAVVRAVVVLRDGHAPSAELARELQEHVKTLTAPYKYPRIVDFARELPKTSSGKVKRAQLRD